MSQINPPPSSVSLRSLLTAVTGRVLLVTYDLRTPNYNYEPFFQTLQKQGIWWHYISSTWLIATTKTPNEVYEAVVGRITTNDLLLVVPVQRPFNGYLPREAWDWLERNLPK